MCRWYFWRHTIYYPEQYYLNSSTYMKVFIGCNKILNKSILVQVIFWVLSFSTMRSQETVVPFETYISQDQISATPLYYKDIQNKLNPYVGTFVYDNAPHYLKIKIEKIIHQLDPI